MKIESLTIYGYGKWQEKRIDLNGSFVGIIGKNEAGKSTLQSFIRSILFGFPTKKDKNNAYVPKRAVSYGGKMTVSDTPYGTVVIERTRKPNQSVTGCVAIWKKNGEVLPESSLSHILGGVTLEMYDKFYALHLDNLRELSTVKSSDLNRYFLTIGKTGSEQLYDWIDTFYKKSNALYSKQAQKKELNQKIQQLSDLSQKIDRAKKRQQQYVVYTKQEQDLINDKQSLEKKEHVLKQAIKELEYDRGLYSDYLSFLSLKDKASIKSDGLTMDECTKVHEYQYQLEQLTYQIEKLNERMAQIDQPHETTLSWYIQNRQSIKKTMNQLHKIDTLLKESQQIEYALSLKQDVIEKHEQQWSVKIDDLPASVILTSDAYQRFLNQEKQIMHAIQKSKMQLALINQSIDEQKEKLQKFNVKPAKSLKTQPVWSVVPLCIGCILGILLFAINLPLASLVSVLCCFGVSGYLYYKEYQMKKKVRQQKKQESMVLRQKNIVEENLKEWVKQLEQEENKWHYLEKENSDLQESIQGWKREKQLPEHLTLQQFSQIPLGLLQETMDEINIMREQLKDRHNKAEQYLTDMAYYIDFFGMDKQDTAPLTQLQFVVTDFKQVMDAYRLEEMKWSQQTILMQQLQRDKSSAVEQLQQIKQNQMELFAKIHVDTMDAFLRKEHEMVENKQQNQQYLFLKQQLSGRLNRLETYDTLDALLHELTERQEALLVTQQEQSILLEQLAFVKQEKRALESDGQLADLMQEKEILVEEMRELMVVSGGYLLGAKIMECVLNEGSDSYLPTILKTTATFMSYLLGQSVALVMQDDQLFVQKEDTMYQLDELSRGTLEQLYITIRLSFLKHVAYKMIALPLLIDDCFVNFDKDRQIKMYTLLEEFSSQQQIIYFATDDFLLQETLAKRVYLKE